MSEYVNYKGKLKLIHKKENETYGDFCKRVALTCPGCDENLPSYYDTWEEYLIYEFYDYYVVVGENVYRIMSKQQIDYDESTFDLTKLQDEEYKYNVRYYNGGCCFSEAIQYAFKENEVI